MLALDGLNGVVDVTEEAGYGFAYFRDKARSRRGRALLPLFAALTAVLAAAGQSPSLALPYLNLLFRRER